MALDVTGIVASAFLDAQGRFAKDPDLVATVRIWFAPGDSPAAPWTELTVEEFNALAPAARETIRNAGSAAGLVVTEGKSNA